MQYFDSHAHLDEACFDADREEIFRQLPALGIVNILNIGCDLASSERSVQLAGQHDFVYAAVGSHPDDADRVNEARIAVYRNLAQNEKVRAIGEIGLDYHYEDVPRQVQKQAFRMQMALAEELKLPVVVHEREAHEDGLAIVREFPNVTGVFHCFSGSVELAKELVRRGWYIGFTGVITFKNARKAVEVARFLPLDRILIETDCPYMAPEPYRGRRNDSRYVPYMAAKIAEIKQLPVEQVAAATTENARRLFRISK